MYHSSPEVVEVSNSEPTADVPEWVEWAWHSQGQRPISPQGWQNVREDLKLIEADMFPHICKTFKKPPFSAELNRILEIKATKKELSPLMSDNI